MLRRMENFRPRAKISAFVVSYNRAAFLGTCLRALHFADEIIVVDKSSTDDSCMVAQRYADRVVAVPWSPTVEETRTFALSQCTNEWILFLDDDECLSPEAACFIQNELAAPRAEVYALPLRHYILGVHDEGSYYWPEHHIRCFRRGSVTFGSTVHSGVTVCGGRVMNVAPNAGVCIHHLSHPDVASWIDRTNRYTSRHNRARVATSQEDLVEFAHGRIDHWIERSSDTSRKGYTAAVALLRAIYDVVDRLKAWEEERGADGVALLRQACEELDARIDLHFSRQDRAMDGSELRRKHVVAL